MKEKIMVDLKNAMKNQNRELLSVIRMVKGAIQLEEIRLKRELNDEEIIGVIEKQIKTRKESIVEFEKGNRDDLVKQTQKEVDILKRYMPEAMSEEEVDALIEEAFAEVNPSGMSDMGKVMAIVTPKVKGRADMGEVSKKIKTKIASL